MAIQEPSKSTAKRIYDRFSKDDRSIVKMFVDYLSKPVNRDKSTAKVIVDFLSNNPQATVTKSNLTKVANQVKAKVIKPLGSPKGDDALVKKMEAEGKKKPLDTRPNTKAELKTLERNLAKDRRLRKENENINRARKTPLPIGKVEPKRTEPKNAKTPDRTAKDKRDSARKFVTANFGKNVELKSPNVSESNLNRAEKALAANKDDGLTEGDYGTRAGTAAIRGFFKDTLGIENIEVDYTFPGDDGEDTPQGRKSGGKVTPKRAPTKKAAKSSTSSTKKYSMNKGGKVASVRKPTRA